MSDPHLWPINPSSPTPAKDIDWYGINSETIEEVKATVIRKIARGTLIKLKTNFGYLWDAMSEECREAALAIIEGRPESKAKKKTKKPTNRKEELLQELDGIVEDAEAMSDLNVRLKALEVKAKLEALLNVKQPEVDQVVNINIVTGVSRG